MLIVTHSDAVAQRADRKLRLDQASLLKLNMLIAESACWFSPVRRFRRHYQQLALVLTGIALGVAVVLAVDLANQSANASFEQSTRQLSGATTHEFGHHWAISRTRFIPG